MPKKTKTTTTEESDDPFADVFAFLKSIPQMTQYKGMKAAEAYAFHADTLESFAKESDNAATPKGSHAFVRHTAAAARTRLRARLCSLVADGQSIQAAIATVFTSRDSSKAETPAPKKAQTKQRTSTKRQASATV